MLTGPVLAQADRGANGKKLIRPPAEPARLPYMAEWAWQGELWLALSEGITSIADYLGYPWRPLGMTPDRHHITSFPGQCVGTIRSPLYQEVGDRC